MLELDRGWQVALTLKDRWHEQRKLVDIIPCYDSRADVSDSLHKLKQELFKISAQTVAKTFDKDVVIIDSLTAIGEVAKRQVMGSTAQRLTYTLTQAQWGLVITELENILYVIQSLSVPVILICHSEAEMVEEVITKVPAIYGKKLPETLPAKFDEVWYARVSQVGETRQYTFQTKMSPGIVAKSRANLPTPVNQDEGMEKIFSFMGYQWPVRNKVTTATGTMPVQPVGAQ